MIKQKYEVISIVVDVDITYTIMLPLSTDIKQTYNVVYGKIVNKILLKNSIISKNIY